MAFWFCWTFGQNFEAAVMDNVLVNGQRWEDAAEGGSP